MKMDGRRQFSHSVLKLKPLHILREDLSRILQQYYIKPVLDLLSKELQASVSVSPLHCKIPHKANPPQMRPSWWNLNSLIHGRDRIGSPDPSSSGSATPAGGPGRGRGFDKRQALGAVGIALDGLKQFSEMSDYLVPLGLVCDGLKLAVTTAEIIIDNEETRKNLLNKLHRQLSFIQDKTASLSDARFRPSRNSTQGLVKSLETYKFSGKLDELQERLDLLRRKDKGRIKRFLSKISSVDLDCAELDSCTRQLEEAFRLLMDSVTFFIADQNGEILAIQTLNQLHYVEGSQGNKHSTCLPGTREAVLNEIAQWASSKDGKPLFALVDRAGTGKSTISRHMAQQWDEELYLACQFFFYKPKGITSGEHMADTLAKDMASRIPFLRSFIIKALNEHPTIMGYTIEKKLELLIFTPLRELKDDNKKALSQVHEEMRRNSFFDMLDLEKWHGNVQGRAAIDNLKWVYANTLKGEKTGREEEHRKEVGEAAMAYLKALESALSRPLIIVIESLSECLKDDRNQILLAFLHYLAIFLTDTAPFILFLTCRPEEDVTSLLYDPSHIQHAQFSLHLKDAPSNQRDIELYSKTKLQNTLNAQELSNFTAKANGLFIWAATAATFILDANDESSMFSHLMASTLQENPLDTLYDAIIEEACQKVGRNETRRLLELLQLISVARKPLTVDAMDDLLGLLKKKGSSPSGKFVSRLGSVLSDGSNGEPVQALHPTFIEYLERNLSPRQFPAVKGDSNLLITEACFSVLPSQQLHRHLYDVVRPEVIVPANHEIENLQQQIQLKVSPGIQYAAEYAMIHMLDCLEHCSALQSLLAFFQEKLLYWIELMSYIGKMPVLTNLIHVLAARLMDTINNENENIIRETQGWCNETERMIQPFQASITESALQVYYSALAFTPHGSRISSRYHKPFKGLIPRVKHGFCTLKPDSIQLGGHTGWIICISFSPDGSKIVSGSRDNTLRLWDAESGMAIGNPLSGHTGWVSCLSFSPDGRKIASGSRDKTIRLWDASTGTTIGEPLLGHTNWVRCLAFSPDGRKIVSGSSDTTLRLWDANTGELIVQPLFGHTGLVNCLSFSLDGRKIASGSFDKTVRLWDAETGAAIGSPLSGHTDWIKCLSFSPDGRKVASGLRDKTVRVWDARSGAAIGQPLSGHIWWVQCLSFSPDGRKIASGSRDTTVRLWDANTGEPIGQPLSGHIGSVNCLSFSPDGHRIASGSDDHTVRLWDPETSTPIGLPLSGRSGRVSCLSFSPDGRKITSGSTDRTVHLWDIHNGAEIGSPPSRIADWITCLLFSPDGRKIASGSCGGIVQMWDANSGDAIGRSLTSHTCRINCLSFSPDGLRLASGSDDGYVRVWEADTVVQIGQPLIIQGFVDSLEFSVVNTVLFLNINQSYIYELSGDPSSPTLCTNPMNASAEDHPMTPPSNSLLYFEDPWTTICSKSYVRFCLPSHFTLVSHKVRHGKIVYGGEDGSIIIVDCSHLL